MPGSTATTRTSARRTIRTASTTASSSTTARWNAPPATTCITPISKCSCEPAQNACVKHAISNKGAVVCAAVAVEPARGLRRRTPRVNDDVEQLSGFARWRELATGHSEEIRGLVKPYGLAARQGRVYATD